MEGVELNGGEKVEEMGRLGRLKPGFGFCGELST